MISFLEYVKEKAEVSLTCLNTWQHTTTYSYIYSQNSPLALLHDTENSALLRTVMGSQESFVFPEDIKHTSVMRKTDLTLSLWYPY